MCARHWSALARDTRTKTNLLQNPRITSVQRQLDKLTTAHRPYTHRTHNHTPHAAQWTHRALPHFTPNRYHIQKNANPLPDNTFGHHSRVDKMCTSENHLVPGSNPGIDIRHKKPRHLWRHDTHLKSQAHFPEKTFAQDRQNHKHGGGDPVGSNSPG